MKTHTPLLVATLFAVLITIPSTVESFDTFQIGSWYSEGQIALELVPTGSTVLSYMPSSSYGLESCAPLGGHIEFNFTRNGVLVPLNEVGKYFKDNNGAIHPSYIVKDQGISWNYTEDFESQPFSVSWRYNPDCSSYFSDCQADAACGSNALPNCFLSCGGTICSPMGDPKPSCDDGSHANHTIEYIVIAVAALPLCIILYYICKAFTCKCRCEERSQRHTEGYELA